MKIIKPYVEFIDEPNYLKKIELAGRVCYKSEDLITEDSAERFIANVLKRGHESVIEHANFIVGMCTELYAEFKRSIDVMQSHGIKIMLNVTECPLRNVFMISGNARMWRDYFRSLDIMITEPQFIRLFKDYPQLFADVLPENIETKKPALPFYTFLDDSYLSTDNEKKTHIMQTVRIVCDRGVTHEIVRHRLASYSQESSRYCCYTKDKFGNEITVIKPLFFDENSEEYGIWKNSCENSEMAYFDLISAGATPEKARDVLPNSLKTEIVMSAYLSEWEHFFKLRCSKAAHPQMREIALPLLKMFGDRYPEIFKDLCEEYADELPTT